MPKTKTQETQVSVEAFIDSYVDNAQKKADSFQLIEMMREWTGFEPKMWGPTIIGYGRYHYKYESGREGEFMLTGFSPRKQNLTIYIMPGYRYDSMQDKLSRLGKHKLGKSCLYINKLADVDMDVLEEIVLDGVAYMRDNYETWDA